MTSCTGNLLIRNAVKEINSSAATLDGDKGLIVGPTKTHQDRKGRLPAFLRKQLAAFLAEPSTPNRDGLVVVIRDTEDGPEWDRSADPFDPDAVIFTTATGSPVRRLTPLSVEAGRSVQVAIGHRCGSVRRRLGDAVVIPWRQRTTFQ